MADDCRRRCRHDRDGTPPRATAGPRQARDRAAGRSGWPRPSLFSLPAGASDASAFAVVGDWLFPALRRTTALSARDRIIIYDIRLPRVVLGVLVGAALAVSGAVMQGLFRNPLADPGLVGVSAGAASARSR